MVELILAVALATPADGTAQAPLLASLACTRRSVEAQLASTGVADAWPPAASLPAGPAVRTERLASFPPGPAFHAVHYDLHAYADEGAIFLVQRGGMAGLTRIFGPLVVSGCPASTGAAS